jgi:hypothetical protein
MPVFVPGELGSQIPEDGFSLEIHAQNSAGRVIHNLLRHLLFVFSIHKSVVLVAEKHSNAGKIDKV